MEFLIFVAFVAVVVIIIRARLKKVRVNRWIALSNHLGLGYVESSGQPELKGDIDGRTVKIKISEEGSGNHGGSYSRVEIRFLRPLRPDFQLMRQGHYSRNNSYPGMQDILVGEPEFDNRIIVQGLEEQNVRLFFQRERARKACLDVFLPARYNKIRITNHLLGVSLVGGAGSIRFDELKRTISHLSAVAEILEAESAGFSRPPPIAKPPPLPVRKKKRVIPKPVQEAPEIEEIVEEPPKVFVEPPREIVDEPDEVEERVETAELREVEVEVNPGLSIDEVADLLFERKLGRYAAGQRFDELLKDERVVWKHRLQTIEPGDHDRFFGRGAGSIGVFDLGVFPGMESGFGRLVAKYRMGRERREAIDDPENAAVEISGRLVKFDPFTTTLYIDSEDRVEAIPAEQPVQHRYIPYAERMKEESLSKPGEVKGFRNSSK